MPPFIVLQTIHGMVFYADLETCQGQAVTCIYLGGSPGGYVPWEKRALSEQPWQELLM
jgi:hypothetical protein